MGECEALETGRVVFEVYLKQDGVSNEESAASEAGPGRYCSNTPLIPLLPPPDTPRVPLNCPSTTPLTPLLNYPCNAPVIPSNTPPMTL